MTTNDTRKKMVLTAIQLFQQHGYHGTSWRNLVREAGTPWGSIAHHFPGGKVELGCAAIEMGADWVDGLINQCFDKEATIPAAIALWFERTGVSMKATNYESGCPVASIALATSPQVEELTLASQRAFKQWETTLAKKMIAVGISRTKAIELAALTITLFEGAITRAKIYGSNKPLRVAGKEAASIIEKALELKTV